MKKTPHRPNIVAPHTTKAIGDAFENKACALLEKAGLRILVQNYRVSKVGEIDIVALDGETLVCVEVKARKNHHFGSAVEMVTPSKQQKLINTMAQFVQDYEIGTGRSYHVRFDVIGFDNEESQWVQGAFLAE